MAGTEYGTLIEPFLRAGLSGIKAFPSDLRLPDGDAELRVAEPAFPISTCRIGNPRHEISSGKTAPRR